MDGLRQKFLKKSLLVLAGSFWGSTIAAAGAVGGAGSPQGRTGVAMVGAQSLTWSGSESGGSLQVGQGTGRLFGLLP